MLRKSLQIWTLILIGLMGSLRLPLAGAQEWTQKFPAHTPPRSFRMSLSTDTARNVTVLFGGISAKEEYLQTADTWEWDGDDWTQILTPQSPPARSASAAMAYNSTTGKTILFGGVPGVMMTAYYNDTWEYDGTNWNEIITAHAPQGRSGGSLVYDSHRNVFVLFGGWSAILGTTMYVNYFDTWEFDGTDWTEINVTTIPSSHHGSMVYDSSRNYTYLYTLSNETWRYDGVNWTKLNPAHSPSLRGESTMYFDSVSEVTILFSGTDGPSPYFNDMWMWDGIDWTEVITPTKPAVRKAAAMAFNPVKNTAVMFGGFTGSSPLGDTWEFDLTAIPLSATPTATPPAPTSTPTSTATPATTPTSDSTPIAVPSETPSQIATPPQTLTVEDLKAGIRTLKTMKPAPSGSETGNLLALANNLGQLLISGDFNSEAKQKFIKAKRLLERLLSCHESTTPKSGPSLRKLRTKFTRLKQQAKYALQAAISELG